MNSSETRFRHLLEHVRAHLATIAVAVALAVVICRLGGAALLVCLAIGVALVMGSTGWRVKIVPYRKQNPTKEDRNESDSQSAPQ